MLLLLLLLFPNRQQRRGADLGDDPMTSLLPLDSASQALASVVPGLRFIVLVMREIDPAGKQLRALENLWKKSINLLQKTIIRFILGSEPSYSTDLGHLNLSYFGSNRLILSRSAVSEPVPALRNLVV
jgi:hypothetical protein